MNKEKLSREEAITANKKKSTVRLQAALFVKMLQGEIDKEEYISQSEELGIDMTEMREFYRKQREIL